MTTLKPCPFCGDRMEISGTIIRHRINTDCVISFQAWDDTAIDKWNTRTLPPAPELAGWTKVPEEPTLEFLKSINRDNQVLAYENGRYYNAWFEFEQSEGGWLWTDDADSEPNPSYYRMLGPIALAATEADQ